MVSSIVSNDEAQTKHSLLL